MILCWTCWNNNNEYCHRNDCNWRHSWRCYLFAVLLVALKIYSLVGFIVLEIKNYFNLCLVTIITVKYIWAYISKYSFLPDWRKCLQAKVNVKNVKYCKLRTEWLWVHFYDFFTAYCLYEEEMSVYRWYYDNM